MPLTARQKLDVREGELVKANGQFGNVNTEVHEAKRQIRNLEFRIKEQNNANMVSNMCKKKLFEAETLLKKRKKLNVLLKRTKFELMLTVERWCSAVQCGHPALSVLSCEEAEPTPSVSSKRRLSSNCPEERLPFTDNVQFEFFNQQFRINKYLICISRILSRKNFQS